MSIGIPILEVIAQLSNIKPEGLRFIELTDLQISDLLNELERAQRMVLDGELLGVKIKDTTNA